MLIAIASQESGLRHRDQLSPGGQVGAIGPATSLWQIEFGGGFLGAERHPATAEVLARARKALLLPENDRQRWAATCWCDAYACLLARALLWTLPQALPGPKEHATGWSLYLEAWRPGKPHPEAWQKAWDDGIQAVYGGVLTA